MTEREEILVLKRQLLGVQKQVGLMVRTCERILKESRAAPQEGELYQAEVLVVVDRLNTICKRNFSAENGETALLIRRRLSEGYTIEDFERVIRLCFEAWGNDPKMKLYLRPSTLFGEGFEGYYQAAVSEGSGLTALEEKLKRRFQHV